MPGRGFGGPPLFRGLRGPFPARSFGLGCLGLMNWLFAGLVGFFLGKSYAESQRATQEREAMLQRREEALQRREEELRRREEELRRSGG